MSTDSAQDFRNVEKGLKLLRAYRANLDVPAQRNPAWQKALRDLIQGMTTHEEFEAEMGRVVQGLVILSNLLAELAAEKSDTTADRVVELYESQTQASIAQLEHE